MENRDNCLKLLSFWAVNGELDPSVLKTQLEEMKALGLWGTIFHPRFYPGRPAYMSGPGREGKWQSPFMAPRI